MEKTLLIIGVAALIGAAVFMMTPKTETTQLTIQQNEEIPSQVYDLYSDWKRQYNRKYASSAQDAYRLNVFYTNYQYLQNFYEGPEQTYTLDFTQFMDITNEEFKATYLGYNPETQSLLTSDEGTPAEVREDVPNDVDWRGKGAVTGVKDQGNCGSCWSFSTTGALEGLSALSGKGSQSFSEQQLVDCDKTDSGCNGGLMTNAFKWVKQNGIVTESEYPYRGVGGTCQKSSGAFKIGGYNAINSCDKLKSELASGPVSVAVDASNWQFYRSGVFTNCKTGLNHGVLAVGYNGNAWIVKNSWGTSWGEKGYIQLAVSGSTCGVCSDAARPTM